jgi:hypothetical protein
VKLRRMVAIKVLSPTLAVTSPPRKRFLREARAGAAVNHENVVQVYSVEEVPLPYLVMEFVDGHSLQDKMNREGPLELPDIVEIGGQIASGLAAAHALGLVHRDIKPGNILLSGGVEQKVKITDFGLARAAADASLTQSGMLIGTPLYMAPEQARAERVDHRADLFSLGSVLYAMACGHPPFRAADTFAVLRRVAEDTPRPLQEMIPELPGWLVVLIGKLLAKDPQHRVQSAQEVAGILGDHQGEPPAAGLLNVGSTTRPSSEAVDACHDVLRLDAETAAAASRGWRRPLLLLAGAALLIPTVLVATMLRQKASVGTLQVYLSQPGATVQLQNVGGTVEVLRKGVTGPLSLEVGPGQHRLTVQKEGFERYSTDFSIEPGGRMALTARLVPIDTGATARAGGPTAVAPGSHEPRPWESARFRQWESDVQALSAPKQVEAVGKRLEAQNPGFDGTDLNSFSWKIDDADVTELHVAGKRITDLSPIRALHRLRRLSYGSDALPVNDALSTDLAPLEGMQLQALSIVGNAVVSLVPVRGMRLTEFQTVGPCCDDFSPLAGMPLAAFRVWNNPQFSDLSLLRNMPLKELDVGNVPVRDLSPLAGMNLRSLLCIGTEIADLGPLVGMDINTLYIGKTNIENLKSLKDMSLINFDLDHTPVTDLSPLAGMKLRRLNCTGTGVTDLSPVAAMDLEELYIEDAPITDLSPLQGLHLSQIILTPRTVTKGMDALRTMASLKGIGVTWGTLYEPAEFWRRYDAGEFKGPKAGP